MGYDELIKRKASINSDFDSTIKNIDEEISEIKRVENIASNTKEILDDLDKRFEEETSLRGKDIVFLFSATVLQTLRWVLLPNLDLNFKKTEKTDRLTSNQGGQIEKNGIIEKLKQEGYDKKKIDELMKTDHINNYTWQKLLIAPVPYDAMSGSSRISIPGISEQGKELYGKNHHVATWGHDPIVGWIIGPLNITSRMITFKGFQTFHVAQVGDSFNQVITYKSNFGTMFDKSLNAWKSDPKKLVASVVKQGLHQQSDKYTKNGLQIPLIRADKAQHLLNEGWNSYELERILSKTLKNIAVVGAQYEIAKLIETIIRVLHILSYDSEKDGSFETYAVKTQKIILYSSAMAEITNALYVLWTEDVNKLDIGGYIHFVSALMHYSKLQRKVKEEFIFGNYKKMIMGE